MKKTSLILLALCCVASTGAFAAEKSKIISQIDASRAALDSLAGKAGENREAAAALEKARESLKKASDISGKGRQVLGINIGFGDLKPEAEEEINNYLGIADNSIATAASRLEKARTASELENIDKQLAIVKAKVKVFDERKAELEKLKADAAKCQTASKDIETLKAEKSSLTMQVELLMAERGKADKLKSEQADLLPRMEAMKTENSRLSGQIDKQLAEIKALTAQLEEAKKTAVKVAAPEVKQVPAVSQAPKAEIPEAKGQLAPAK